MKRFIGIFIAVAILFLITSSVYAQRNNYGDIKLGLFRPNDKEEGLKDFDIGGNFEAIFGRKINPNLAIELGIGYYSSKYSRSYPDWKIKLTASAIPITATIKGIVPLLSSYVELYGGGGFGLYLARLETDLTVYGVGSRSISKENSPFGFHVVGGGTFYFSDRMGVGMEIKWFTVKPKFEGESVEYGGIVVNAGLRFRF